MYATKLIPRNIGLAVRLANVNSKQIIHQIKRNLKANLYQDGDPGFFIPNSIYINPTYECNRKCVGCYVDQDKGMMSHQLAEEISDYAMRNNVNYISWLGGEPLLPKVKDLVFDVTKNFSKLSYVYCTNGDFVDEDVADKTAELPNLTPFVSVDGVIKTHNWRRGQNSYENAMNALKLFKQRNLLTGFMTTVMPENQKEVSSPAFINEMIERGCMVGGFSMYACAPGENSLNPKEYATFAKRLHKRSKEFPLYIMSTDFGYMGNKLEQGSKKITAISVGPNGEVTTERGKIPNGQMGNGTTLDMIVASKENQRIFKDKYRGTRPIERDQRIKVLQETEV